MAEILDESIDLVVTSPPYWQIKDYGAQEQIGHGQSLHAYLYDLARVWQECWRTLKKGRRLCINIGDQFARASWYGRYKIIPLHAEIIAQCEKIGFDYMGSIIWRKKTTLRPSGGAVVMGSFPYPPNGIVELDYEYILIFKKPGEGVDLDKAAKEKSILSKEEWKTYFSGHWEFAGERQVGHLAMFPEELPRRLIRMFSLVGEVVLDPFIGSGTTAKVAIALGRSAIGYEIQTAYEPIIREKLGIDRNTLWDSPVLICHRQQELPPVSLKGDYHPFLEDFCSESSPEELSPKTENIFRVLRIIDEIHLLIEGNCMINLAGIIIRPEKRQEAIEYLQTYLLGKKIIFKPLKANMQNETSISAYVYLENKIFINRKMIEMGLAKADPSLDHKYRDKFISSECHG